MTRGADFVALERQGWEALAEGRGGEYYRENLADAALMAFSVGLMDRQAAIAAMEQAPRWATFELIDPKVIELTDDSGVVAYRAKAQRAGELNPWVVPRREPARGATALTSKNSAAFPCCRNRQTRGNAVTSGNGRSKCAPGGSRTTWERAATSQKGMFVVVVDGMWPLPARGPRSP